MRIKHSSLLTLILVLPLMVAADLNAAPLRGFVVDAASGEPLPSASISIEGTQYGTATNSDGYFVLHHSKTGMLSVTVSYLGYVMRKLEIDATTDDSKPFRIELVRKGLLMKGATIKARKTEDEEVRSSPRVSTVPVDAKIIKMMPSLGGEMDVLRALQSIPGVKASSDLSSALYVRGGSPDQTLILMDNTVVYNPSHLFGLFSTFNTDAVKRIELIKGGFPAEYGGRSGSVLAVITNDGNRKESQGLFSVGLVSAKGAYEGPLPNGKGSYAFSGRRTYFDPMLTAMRDALGEDLPSYYFYDVNGKVNFDISDRTTFTLAGYQGDDVMKFNLGPSDERLYFELGWGNKTLTSRLRHAINRDLYISGGVGVSEYNSNWMMEDTSITLDEGVNKLQDISYKADLEYHGLEDHQIKTGVWVSRYGFKFRESGEDLVYVDVAGHVNNYAAYVQDNWRINPIYEVQLGLRGYYHEAGSHRALDPRAALVYHYDDRRRVKLAVGRYTQWMNLMTFGEGFTSFDTWFPIDGSMNPPHSDQVIIGYEWDREDGYEITTEAYYTEMLDVAQFDPMVDSGESLREAFAVGRGFAYGGEIMLQKKVGRLTGWLGYSLSWTKRRFPNSTINAGNWYYPKWDRRHDFIVTTAYPLSDSWDLSASWRYNTGQGFTQALGVYTTRYADLDPSDFANDNRTVLPGSKNNYRFPDDHRLDLTATYKHLFMGMDNYPAKLNFSIFNAYSRRSYWGRMNDDPVANPIVITDAKLLPILPLISYEVRF